MQSVQLVADVTIAALAACQIVETWTFGSIFTPCRIHVRGWAFSGCRLLRWLAKMLDCPFCMSHWAAAATILWILQTDLESVWRFPLYWLAAVKAATAIQSRDDTSPPDPEIEIPPEPETSEYR